MFRARHDIHRFLHGDARVVVVTVAEARGSAPREEGAWMLVSPSGIFRTIGGGQLEYLAIDHARTMIRTGAEDETLSVPLGPEIGQCCGGHVSLHLQALDQERRSALVRQVDAELAGLIDVYIFGAGHVGRALAEALSLLPLRPVLVDTRAGELETAPDGVETCLTAVPEAVVRDAAAGSAFVILTHEHSQDFLIAGEALARGDAAYVGMIGSRSKRASFMAWLRRQANSPVAADALVCPIGAAGLGDKRPEVIASFVAAEIMSALAAKTRALVHAEAVAEETPGQT
ncbi:MAG: xanthine dehydrogenase accessory protein XdhC [Paracoccaceae bacterium]